MQRSRPQYERVLALDARLQRPETTVAARAELAGLLEEWSASLYGFDPVDPEVTLASVRALSYLAGYEDRAAELAGLLAGIEEGFSDDAPPNPDLGLAFVLGWRGLLSGPPGRKIAFDERRRALEIAQRVAARLDPADGPDDLGHAIAQERFLLLVGAERRAEARAMLEAVLESLPRASSYRPSLLAALADEYLLTNSFERAWALLHEAEECAARASVVAPTQRRILLGTRCHLELACGLVDRAALTADSEREVVENGADDDESHLDLLQNLAAVALAAVRSAPLAARMKEIDAFLARPGVFARVPAYRASVLARRALMQDMWETLEGVEGGKGLALIGAAAKDPLLDSVHRTALGLHLALRAMQTGALEDAARWLELASAPSPGGAPPFPQHAASLAATRALLALERGDERGELERHAREVGACFEDFLTSWAATPEREGGFGFLRTRHRRILLEAVIELRLALDGEAGPENVLELLLREEAPGSLSRRLGEPVQSLAQARAELLGAGTGLLLFVPGARELILLAVDATRVTVDRIPWRFELETLPRDVLELLANSPAGQGERERDARLVAFDRLTTELGTRLLPAGTRARLARWSGVYVVPSHALSGIPFESLPIGGGRLGARLGVAYLPSLQVGLQLARAPSSSAHGLDLVLLAAPDPQAGSPRARIPFDGVVRSALTAGFERTLVLSGGEASLGGLLGALAQRPAALHVFAHGISDPERELSSGLELAPCADDPDGALWCEDILRATFTCPPLVLLSACGAARGPLRAGDDGLEQLGGALLGRGARCVVQATGAVAFEPTVLLMETFGRELGKGATPAQAMLAARLALDERFADPFYSVALRVYGLGFERLSRTRK